MNDGIYPADRPPESSALVSMARLLRLGKPVYLPLGASIGLVLLASWAVVGSGMAMGKLVALMQKVPERQDFWHWGSIFLLFEILAVGLRFAGRGGLSWCSNQITFQCRSVLAEKLAKIPMRYFDQHPSGRTITRLTTDVEGVESFFAQTLPRLASSLIEIVVVFGAMMLFQQRVGMLTLLSAVPAIWFVAAFRHRMRWWMQLQKKRSAILNSRLAEFIRGMEVFRILRALPWVEREYGKLCQDHLETNYAIMHWNAFLRPAMILLCALPVISVFWFGGNLVLAGEMDIALFVAFVRYAERFLQPVRVISQEIQVIQNALTSCERIVHLLEEREEDTTGTAAAARAGDIQMDQQQAHRYEDEIVGAVEFRDVFLSYDGNSFALQGVDLKVPAGYSVGLVGPTGAGKSSILNLIPALYPLQQGEILLDGYPLSQWNIHRLRQQLGYIGQEVTLFAGSLAENLLGYPGQEISSSLLAEMESACHQVGLSRLLARFPDRLLAKVEERGGNLSLGEQQLLAFARMLLRNPRILLMDEATASIDLESEKLIQAATAKVCQGRTTFIVAHRLSTVKSCDLILVVSHGKIVEQGKHDSLMQAGGLYHTLYTAGLAGSGEALH